MWQLYQFPLCPFSRKVRLTLAEKGIRTNWCGSRPGSTMTISPI